ncbi:TPA: transaldolase [Klebsiella variicola subsp. variicola]|nr:transaldolase [Klebsiella variicola subsp. variicola]
MKNTLTHLERMTKIVADTSDIEAIKIHKPIDATTNPSIILNAINNPAYHNLINDALRSARDIHTSKAKQLDHASTKIAVNIGTEICKFIIGRVSTEVDARLSFDTNASINKAREIISFYKENGIDKNRILIKLAATWEGIKAAELLEKEGIKCNLTLIFSFAQARACADASVYLISPFVGRILDWHKANRPEISFSSDQDPGVISVRNIYYFYKEHGYSTIVMGASFRNKNEIMELAGCDFLTISPSLLDELSKSSKEVVRRLNYLGEIKNKPTPLCHAEFSWMHNEDQMAVEKLSEGIRNFSKDQEKLESMLLELL